MDLPVQGALEYVISGTIFLALVVILCLILTGGKHPSFARNLNKFFFNVHPWSHYPSKDQFNPLGSLEGFFLGLLALGLVYSSGVALDRMADDWLDEKEKQPLILEWFPVVHLDKSFKTLESFVQGNSNQIDFLSKGLKTDKEIKNETFKNKFRKEKKWLEEVTSECIDNYISETYYAARSYLVRKSDSVAKELDDIHRSILFSESMTIIWVLGTWAFFFIWIGVIFLNCICNCSIKGRKMAVKVIYQRLDQTICQNWLTLKWKPAMVLFFAIYIFSNFANIARVQQEQKYNTLVFGYYLDSLQHALNENTTLASSSSKRKLKRYYWPSSNGEPDCQEKYAPLIPILDHESETEEQTGQNKKNS